MGRKRDYSPSKMSRLGQFCPSIMALDVKDRRKQSLAGSLMLMPIKYLIQQTRMEPLTFQSSTDLLTTIGPLWLTKLIIVLFQTASLMNSTIPGLAWYLVFKPCMT